MDGVGERGDVENADLPFLMQPNLDDAWPDGGHRPPVIRIESLLNLAELIPCRTAGAGKARRSSKEAPIKFKFFTRQLY